MTNTITISDVDAIIDRQNASSSADYLPNEDDLVRWVNTALTHPQVFGGVLLNKPSLVQAELTIRLVDEPESQQLNNDYRQKDKPTNVLSFPADLPDIVDLPLLGDLIICAPVVIKEAEEQQKPLQSHWAHMVVHGTLHLLGYDHIDENDANIMEAIETDVLAAMGIACPYTVGALKE
ncbi:A heat shock protein involved in translation [gamma proteobacterium IMCC1989]|nr:A heat shock protein involved in translation [gamma proteobacterium IMCC1989]